MGFLRADVGRFGIELRRESFIIHPSYGYDAEGNEHSDETSARSAPTGASIRTRSSFSLTSMI